MRRRSGITLVEVLVAIFIMGVGLLAVLVLFPLGALNMARAIRADRAMHCGSQAEAIANLWDLRHDAAVTAALDASPLTRSDVPATAVFIDPFGAPTLQYIGQSVSAGFGSPGLRRISPSGLSAPVGERWFTLPDDLVFNPDGTPAGTPGVSVQRTGAYSWTYIARRPQYGNRSVVELSVVVYKGRQTLAPDPEPLFNGNLGAVGTNALDITVTAGAEPELRAQGYILDVSPVAVPGGTVPAARTYRVTEIQKTGTRWNLRVEPPLLNNVTSVVALENVIAVFDKGIGWQP